MGGQHLDIQTVLHTRKIKYCVSLLAKKKMVEFALCMFFKVREQGVIDLVNIYI